MFSAGSPQDVHVDTVKELLLSVRGVVDVHSLHVWSLNMTHSLLSVHVAAGTGKKITTANLFLVILKRIKSVHSFNCGVSHRNKKYKAFSKDEVVVFLLTLA